MKSVIALHSLAIPVLTLMLLAGCGGSDDRFEAAAPLSADHINLIFVVGPDLANHAEGDIHPDTANLTNQGLQRSLLLATYLKRHVLGSNNVAGIYALAPMSHLQTEGQH